jgi:glycerol-3-phosphate acyltransferase PlsY
MLWLIWIALLIGGYLVGSIPSAFILVKLKNGVDIRRFGSGNVGTTNTVRAAGHFMGALVFIFDVAKGAIPTLIGMIFSQELALVAGLAAFIGHIWPIWLSFKGGKGVATGFGVALAVNPLLALIIIASWFLVSLITNYVSLGSCTAAALLPILAIFFHQTPATIIVFFVMASLIIWRHQGNFRNIKAGTEGKLFNRNK